jgi:hypothetical protein
MLTIRYKFPKNSKKHFYFASIYDRIYMRVHNFVQKENKNKKYHSNCGNLKDACTKDSNILRVAKGRDIIIRYGK